MSVTLGYSFDFGHDLYLDATGRVKLPTASRSKRLGTGKVDVTLGADDEHIALGADDQILIDGELPEIVDRDGDAPTGMAQQVIDQRRLARAEITADQLLEHRDDFEDVHVPDLEDAPAWRFYTD